MGLLFRMSRLFGCQLAILAHPAGLPPANSPFEAEDDNNFTTDAKYGAPTGTRTPTFPLKRRTLWYSSSRSIRDAKAESNRRGQICKAWPAPGFRVA